VSHIWFTIDSLLFVITERGLVDGTLACLDMFCEASGFVVSAHKKDSWLVGMDASLDWIPLAWTHV
jgi:hypothetical protein